jgi:hypothetical protein
MDPRLEMSTDAVLTSKPASASTFAAASAVSPRRSASNTCLPALTRRAIATPIEPAPITTITSLRISSLLWTADISGPAASRKAAEQRSCRRRGAFPIQAG